MSHDPSATTELIARAERAFLPNYKPAPMVLDHGKGAWLFDKEGKDYVDLVGGMDSWCRAGLPLVDPPHSHLDPTIWLPPGR